MGLAAWAAISRGAGDLVVVNDAGKLVLNFNARRGDGRGRGEWMKVVVSRTGHWYFAYTLAVD